VSTTRYSVVHERESDFGIWWSLGWPYETAAALSQLVYRRRHRIDPE
jgi:hypothetical protein